MKKTASFLDYPSYFRGGAYSQFSRDTDELDALLATISQQLDNSTPQRQSVVA